MNNVYIIAKNFTDLRGRINVGGVETYIQALVMLLKNKFKVVIVQNFNKSNRKSYDDFELINIPSRNIKTIVKTVESISSISDIVIFSTEQWAAPTKNKSIVIQHGIYWDLNVGYYSTSRLAKCFPQLFKFYDLLRNYRRIKPHDNVVCVDYTYPTWYKTIVALNKKKFCIIPNFSSIDPIDHAYPTPIKRVLFARRFVEIRGVDILIESIKYLEDKYTGLQFDIVGSGPLEERIKFEFENKQNVSIYRATLGEMTEIINKSDLIIVPSLGSEGTSLIAIEAMACGKIVLATNVGGIPNIIIDEFNGYLSNPDLKSFRFALDTVFNKNEFENACVRNNAISTVKSTLTLDKWMQRWERVLEDS